VRTDGTLWAWGLDFTGAPGTGASAFHRFPEQVGTATSWRNVAAGYGHSLALRTDGTLWSWASNTFGQLGNGTTTASYAPAQVGTATTWETAALGANGHVGVLRTDGTLWTWGNNVTGQLGDGTTTNRSLPAQLGMVNTWQAVAGGFGHTVALRADGSLWAWGDNQYGQLGTGTLTNSTAPVYVTGGAGPLAILGKGPGTSALRLVPNPARGHALAPELGPTAPWRLLDAQGRTVRQGAGPALPLEGLSPGIYLLHALGPGQILRTCRLSID
jgi:alpha-tubulin suppressor-like RCC1 family protein